ncbi:MAG: malto-oligosyltrehalose trehalohydrolase [Candidatus Marsarchaeota archaeon]|nr:malto-oligosyltrehalose trehalohydrolase [Candidatus Marsarchaeota archaeon]
MWSLPTGANYRGEYTEFRVWAPKQKHVYLKLVRGEGTTEIEMHREDKGYFSTQLKTRLGEEYVYVIDRGSRPDPCSRWQAKGVHGPSTIVSTAYPWTDSKWKGVVNPVVYELHVGCFAKDFEGVISKLDYLAGLGVNAIELMPVAQFPGSRNWGYDGVLPYAVQNTYGGPYMLKKLVDAAHARKIGVILDVVYNHLGPEGNVLADFGAYFSERYRTPWGPALNYDGPFSDEVRSYVVNNALYWIYEYHVDGLRLDAIHGIYDFSPRHVIREIADSVRDAEAVTGRKILLIAESDLNDPRVIRGGECGYGCDLQWADDLHHAVHAFVTGERDGYYADFGSPDQLVKGFSTPFIYDGVYSRFRNKTHGARVKEPPNKFVVYSQNHDQVGNRADGKRLISLVGVQKALIAATLCTLAPYTPMFFMGEEYGEESDFVFFTDFGDDDVIRGVRQGRRSEYGEHYYDPQSLQPFKKSMLTWKIDESVFDYYRKLIRLKQRHYTPSRVSARYQDGVLEVRLDRMLVLAAFQDASSQLSGEWRLVLRSNPSFPETISGGRIRLMTGCGVYEEPPEAEDGVETPLRS